MQPIIKITPPLLSDANIEEKITCIRAHRERIFRITTEIRNNTLICHNYGHGGAGWTFLFGSVNESIRQFEKQLMLHECFKHKPITIIGAGCYGLLTAITLSRKGYKVKIVAQETKNIPSNKAAGFFFPRWRKNSTPAEIEQFTTTGIESYRTYISIIQGTHPFIKRGPAIIPAYYGLDIDPGFTPYIQAGFMAKPHRVTIDFDNGKAYDVMHYETVFINTAEIMKELWHNFNQLSIELIPVTVKCFDEIDDSIIFNCAGMGAKYLTQDKRIIPVQGHLITLTHQPDKQIMNYMLNVKVTTVGLTGKPKDELIYYAPKNSGILGITFIRGEPSLNANQHEFDRILYRSRKFFGT